MRTTWLAPAESTVLRRLVYIRSLALVHLIATLTLWPQLPGLVGTKGILNLTLLFEEVWRQVGIASYWRAPSLLWFLPPDAGLHAVCALSVAAAVALLAGVAWEGPLLLVLWVCVVSLNTVGQLWLTFQWDALLAEATLVAMLVARWRPGTSNPPTWGWMVQHWLVFRVLFFSGVSKLAGGDAAWRDGTAVTLHFMTQPMPNPMSWLAHQLPAWAHMVGTYGTLSIELMVPFAIALGLWGRRCAFACIVTLMSLLALTGNYGWLPLLVLSLALTLLDDRDWRRVLPDPLYRPPSGRPSQIFAPVGVAWALLTLLMMPEFRTLPEPLKQVVREVQPFFIVNRYQLFSVISQNRSEIVFEGSRDGETWLPYALPAKPGSVWTRPPQVAPHMPRLDWRLWVAALDRCERNTWVWAVQKRLAAGSPEVGALFAHNPFGNKPPLYVRTRVFVYRFSEPGEPGWWTRQEVGPYCPIVSGIVDGGP